MQNTEAPSREDLELDDKLSNVRAVDLPETAWPKNLLIIVDVLASMWERQGVGKTEAAKLAKDATITLAHFIGGTQLYLPTGENLHTAVRDALIFRAYRSRPFDAEAVAREHRIVPDRARAIYKRQMRLYLESVRLGRGA